MLRQKIPEKDVIIATAIWLNSNGCRLSKISVPKGQGIDNYEDKEKIRNKLSSAGIKVENLNFTNEGADIEAHFSGGIWKIECKGLGDGKISTLRNNFDRALASAVSYYTSKTGIRLGLAMPKNDTYLSLISNRIPQALRESVNLWIFLYDSSTDLINVIEPSTPMQAKGNVEAEWV